MKFDQVLLLFAFIFPTLIYGAEKSLLKGLTCDIDAACVRDKSEGPKPIEFNKTCEDACVYYQCIGANFKFIEGAGCYADFYSSCLYIKTEVKNQVVKNIKKFEYFDQTVMVVTCSDKDKCARDAFASMMVKNSHAYENFGTALTTLDSYLMKPLDKCYPERFPTFFPKVECSTRGWCHSGKNYKELYTGRDILKMKIKTCDACVYYQCTGDGGNKIMGGFGCYEDFENICSGVVPYDVRESIKNNLKHSFHFDKNYLVATCSSGNDCSLAEYYQYFTVNPFSKIKANALAGETCEHAFAGTSSLQINVFTLFGIIIAAFAYYIF